MLAVKGPRSDESFSPLCKTEHYFQPVQIWLMYSTPMSEGNFEALLFWQFIGESGRDKFSVPVILWPFTESKLKICHKRSLERARSNKRQPSDWSALCGWEMSFHRRSAIKQFMYCFSGEVGRHSCESFSHQQSFVDSDYE